MKRLLTFILGVASGALVGASIAILVAPSSGEDLRSGLRDRFGRLRDELQSAADERRTELERQLTNMRQSTREIPLEDR